MSCAIDWKKVLSEFWQHFSAAVGDTKDLRVKEVLEALDTLLTTIREKPTRATYAGRKAAASPATGLASRHKYEQTALVDAALTIA